MKEWKGISRASMLHRRWDEEGDLSFK